MCSTSMEFFEEKKWIIRKSKHYWIGTLRNILMVWDMDTDDFKIVTVDVSDKVKRIRKKYYERKEIEDK